MWVVLTVLFEFSLGRLTKKSWEYLFQNYNILEGHIWPFFCFFYSFYPMRCMSLRNKDNHALEVKYFV